MFCHKRRQSNNKGNPNMYWNTSSLRTVTPFVSHSTEIETTSSFTNILCNPNYYHPFPGRRLMERSNMMMLNCYGGQEKKRRLDVEQLESLERNFQEETKLDPERKMKLARELGLQPRQVAVWFQNRRARWRTKKLEHLYDVLKHEYDAVTRDKLKLHQEVLRLKSMLMEQGPRKQVSCSHNTDLEGSGEETVESTAIATQSYNIHFDQTQGISSFELEKNSSAGARGGGGGGECYPFTIVHDYELVSPSYWGDIPTCYPSK